ncbi:sigma-70 family RNA polymerase sigma factor [Armatimonas sp.]|uniref:sigma-70 family RNA polymerase sigma factor n=1 Tax=Armatimonas sp. TaxID=1872638 RepID=UPI00375279F7
MTTSVARAVETQLGASQYLPATPRQAQTSSAETTTLAQCEGIIQNAVRKLPLYLQDDARQEARLAAVIAMRRCPGGAAKPHFGYIKKAVRNAVCDLVRYEQSFRDLGTESLESPEAQRAESRELSPSKSAERTAFQEILYALPLPQQELLYAVYWDGERQTSIAHRLEVTPQTLNKRLQRTYTTLRERASEYVFA